MDDFHLPVEVIMVDDGSRDDTALQMSKLSLEDDRFQSIFLSRNFGQQIAVYAGLSAINATKALLFIDGDLQDPPEMLPEFYKYIEDGYDVVYAIRKSRKENFIKRFLYKSFYRVLRSMSFIKIPPDAGDFSMITRQVGDILSMMPEENPFFRGMRAWVGFRQIGIEIAREERREGKTKYSFMTLLKFALNGIFNFSRTPINFITFLGIASVSVSLIYFIITLMKKLVYGTVPEGFTALLLAIILFSGVQLISLGIIGEYVLRIYFQVKQRPLFIVKKRIQAGKVIDG